MDPSPRKRQKTSPTTFVPADVPTTPSRIPVRKDGIQPLSGRPSFASPTKASISKHHPQLLRRPSSAGAGAERPGSRGRIEDVFARALGEPRPSIEGNEMPLAQALGTITPRGEAHRRARSDGGALSAKPRRMSRSPFKQVPEKIELVEQQKSAVEEMQENINPFIKRGLRRSPPAGSQDTGVLQDLQEQNINPFEKRGLRRSPVSSHAVQAVGELLGRTQALPEASTVQTEPRLSSGLEPLVLTDSRLPRETDLLTTENYTTQSMERITPNTSGRHEAQLPTNILKQPHSSEVVQPALTNHRQRERHLEENSRRGGHLEQRQETGKEPGLPQNTIEQPRATVADDSVTLRDQSQQKDQDPLPTSTQRVHSSRAVEPGIFSRRQPEEPQLPPTPTQLGISDLVVTTPPTGIHDTPSKRARKKSKSIKSSPLRPRDPPPAVVPKTAESESQQKHKKFQTSQRRRSSRFLVPEDPHAPKKKARDDLLMEIQQLHADVAVGNQEIERLRLQLESRKSQLSAPPNPDELLEMLVRATAPEPSFEPKPKPESIFKSIELFLPFTSRRKRLATALPALENPIPSHLPIVLDDPLPYLQVFSPLTYTSNITLLPPESLSSEALIEETEQPILQRHLIKASHPSGLFSARLSMIVDSSLLSITSLDIEALPSNSEKELGTFMRERSNLDAVFGRDIGVICWAMGRWVEVSILRARFWCTVEEEFGTPEARSKSLQRKVQKRKRRSLLVVNEDDEEHDGGVDDETSKQKWTMRHLLPNMGRTAMELSNKEVELRFEWRISFDWTGEVESSVAASARLPKSCKFLSFIRRQTLLIQITGKKQDDRKSLPRIPQFFDRLVKEKGPLNAVRTVIGLLMPA